MALSLARVESRRAVQYWSMQGHNRADPELALTVSFKLALSGPHFLCCLHCRIFESMLVLKLAWFHPCCACRVSSKLGSVSVLGLV